jgi:prepilin-type N-terminal cleavage/methylation domain-containing protein
MNKNKSLIVGVRKNLGFTLIELLVVIAIIGILSSVVLASLNLARSKGADAKVKTQISGARNSAEVFHDSNGSYNGLAGDVLSDCATVGSMFQDTSSGMDQYINPVNYPPFASDLRCSSTATDYVISAPLSTAGEFWCVDSSGASKQVSPVDGLHTTAHPDGATSCP